MGSPEGPISTDLQNRRNHSMKEPHECLVLALILEESYDNGRSCSVY